MCFDPSKKKKYILKRATNSKNCNCKIYEMKKYYLDVWQVWDASPPTTCTRWFELVCNAVVLVKSVGGRWWAWLLEDLLHGVPHLPWVHVPEFLRRLDALQNGRIDEKNGVDNHNHYDV